MNKTEKRKLWAKAEKEVEAISKRCERHGAMPLDEGTKPLVIALRAYGLPTSGSCEGHFDNPEWITFPEITFVIEPPGHIRKDILEKTLPEKALDTLTDEMEKESAKHRGEFLRAERTLVEFLDEFYHTRRVPFDVRLHISMYKNNAWGVFILESYGAQKCIQESLTTQEQREKTLVYRKELQEFGIFLKEKFFEDQ